MKYLSEWRKFNSKSFKKSLFSSVRLPGQVGCQFVLFSSGCSGQALPFGLFISLHSVKFTIFFSGSASVFTALISLLTFSVQGQQVHLYRINLAFFGDIFYCPISFTLARTSYFAILDRTWGGGFPPPAHLAPNWNRALQQRQTEKSRCSEYNHTRFYYLR